MNKRSIIFIIILILACCAFMPQAIAQGAKTSSGVSQAYSGMGVDMQYYEIKYDPNSKEYISYYQAVREKIMQKLKGLYRYHYRNGDVYLLFIVKSDGKLTRFDIDLQKSTKDKTLIDIAAAGLKRSSPFAPFPEGLALPEISFNVVISFKEKA